MELTHSRTPTPDAGLRFRPDRRSRWISGRRLAGAAAAAAATVMSIGGVLLAFEHASPGPWLAPTPALLAASARCDTLAHRQARERCHGTLMEHARSGAAPGALLAKR